MHQLFVDTYFQRATSSVFTIARRNLLPAERNYLFFDGSPLPQDDGLSLIIPRPNLHNSEAEIKLAVAVTTWGRFSLGDTHFCIDLALMNYKSPCHECSIISLLKQCIFNVYHCLHLIFIACGVHKTFATFKLRFFTVHNGHARYEIWSDYLIFLITSLF